MKNEKNPWRRSDLQFIVENAGSVTPKDMARILKRTEGAIRKKACELRKQGRLTADLRTYHWKTQECPYCMKRRVCFGSQGYCTVCRLEDRIEEHIEKAGKLWDNLEEEYKAKTLMNSNHPEADLRTVLSFTDDVLPTRPSVSGLSPYLASKALDEYYIELEKAELRSLNRQYQALRQRETRWRKKQKN